MKRMPSICRAFALSTLLVCAWLQAITVNRVNGGANLVYVDFSIPGNAVPLELVRTYNSITALNESTGWVGAFGWGWTTPFETTLTTTPERHVILRDGGTGNTVLFRPEKDDPKVLQAFINEIKKGYFEQERKKKLNTAELAKLDLPSKIKSRLKTDPRFRFEMADKYKVSSSVPLGQLLVSSEFGYQTMQFQNNQWIREKDGITQFFDKQGRLSRQNDKNGTVFLYSYHPGQKYQLKEITDGSRTISLRFTWKDDKVTEIVDNKGHRAKYGYDNKQNLIEVTDSANQNYAFRYENKRFPHLLTKIEYQTEAVSGKAPYRELKYDDNGLVIFHRDKSGDETTYLYGKNSTDPENNFWTKVVTKSQGKVDDQYDEYWIKTRKDGSKYLHKQEVKRNGAVTTTLYTEWVGKPAQITENGVTTTYRYYPDGLLKEKISPTERSQFEYDPRWKKVSKVIDKDKTSQYEYDQRGNLVKAFNTKNERVSLNYDKLGRIEQMTNTEGRKINFKYGNNGKPAVISEKGVGTIRIAYDADGKIARTETLTDRGTVRKPSDEKSQEIVRRVMRGFQDLLNIIRPAGISVTG